MGAARTVWAKHDRDSEGWLPLWRHMADSAAVAGLLWDEWLPAQVRRLVGEVLPGGEADARTLTVWLAGVHDIGKTTPAFACQVDSLADVMREAGLAMPTRRQFADDRRYAPHGLAGQLLLGEWLEERHGWSPKQTGQFAVVAGGHHGVPPDDDQIRHAMDRPRLLRTPGPAERLWRQVQEELLEACAQEFGAAGKLAAWRSVRLTQPVQVLLSAVVILSDWIASNPDLFPYFPQETRSSEERVAAAWRGLRLPTRWEAAEPPADVGALFAERFTLPPGAAPRPVQEAAVRAARAMSEPGLMVIEAPMGEGKTEAALAVAEVFAARSGAGGVFFALPTMATSNAMFPRLLSWLDRLPAPGGARLSVLLAHSKAALNDDFSGLRFAGRQRIAHVDENEVQTPRKRRSGPGEAPAELIAHAWLRGRKKAMLSSFVAGTVDQLLFAGLKSRHLALRHLAVAGKVVVIDEVHAYDAYMSGYLDRVLSWLGAYRVPVVVLSATLPAERRRRLAEAYAGAPPENADFEEVGRTGAYPLLTSVTPGGKPVLERPALSSRSGRVWLERLPEDPAALAYRLEAELRDGGCVLVVRNTVRRVRETARQLRERFAEDQITVAHSCFVDLDRKAKDQDLLDRFGPPESSAGRRPAGRGHIVVASQVAEQSLDVDFDLLVTDLCPVDLLLQRIGRLHRHRRGDRQSERPKGLRRARVLVTGVEDWGGGPDGAPPVPVRGSVHVYGAYPLLRSAAVLLPYLEDADRPVRLPRDISPLVQTAYTEETASPAGWADTVARARLTHETHRTKQLARADTFRLEPVATPGEPLFGWVAAGAGEADDTRQGRAQVRDSQESLEVLTVQRREDGSLCTLPWLTDGAGGVELPQDRLPASGAARAVAGCGLRLPREFSDPEVLEQAIEELEREVVPAWQAKDSAWLAGELILALDGDCQTRLAGFSLRYSPVDGLEVIRD
ncbi:CRISPR-associated helicase Cas3' [Streptomyces xiamenensis]